MRRPAAAVLLVEGLVAVVALAVALLLWPDPAPHPERVSARVVRCDFSVRGSAQIAVALHNGDRSGHTYRVELLVSDGSAPIGAGMSLVDELRPGETATARALVPLRGDTATATCRAKATVSDGRPGHRHG
jgi:hypothetical protein